MEDRSAKYGILITVAITILGWGVTFGICQNKIENNTREIERLQNQQYSTVDNMQVISNQLAGLNAKMDLLLDGRIIVKE